ncbi:MAG: hypothetical protein WBG67_08610, partial [Thermoanaerobaculia bacterium]
MTRQTLAQRGGPVFLVLLALGCASAPPTTEPDLGVTVPSQWTASDAASTAPEQTIEAWWTTFADSRLDALITEA